MKKNGFVSISLVYTFFVLFLILMTILLNSYTSKRYSLETYRNDIQNELLEMASEDINLYIYVYNDDIRGYELNSNYLENNTVPSSKFNNTLSYCVNGGSISYDGEIMVQATSKDTCFAYFSK